MDQAQDSAPTRADARRRRRRRLQRAVAVLALGDLGALVAAPALAATPAPFSLQVSANQAVFQVTALKPGPVGQRCLVLQAVNGTADVALLSAQVAGTGLASYLDLMIEEGPASGATSCATMPANVVFAGSLEQLAAGHPDAINGLGIPFAAGTSDTAIRITVSLRDDNRAQGLDATATFSFQADDTSVAGGTPATTLPPVTADPVPLTTPAAPATTASPGRVTTIASATATTVARTTTTIASTTTTGRPTTSAAGVGAARNTTTSPEPAGEAAADLSTPPSIKVRDPSASASDDGVTWSSIPQAVRATVTLTAKASSVPALFLGVVFVFLILQDRIDRNDPKLARAPMRPDPEIVFVPRSQVVA